MEHDDAGTEERKPFDTDVVKEEEDTQPEPDEVLSMDSGGGRVWSVKVCTLHEHERYNPINSPPYRSQNTSWKNGPR